MSETKKKDSNELLNILMIIIGLLFLFKAVMEFLAWADIITPSWAVDPAVLSVFGGQATVSTLLGFWCLVAGVGLFREEEYALGMGLVVLSIMAASGIMTMISWVGGSFDVAYWPNYLIIIATIVGVLGFFWLLFTYKRYD
ncbi:MAG: hypothetical protein ACFE88_00535 [Candidatus Hermodarchaeota archaeon]